MPTLPDETDPSGTAARSPFGALRAALDAIFKEDDRIGGRAVTRLTAALPADDVSGVLVESTIGFGEWVDHEIDPAGAGSARLLINGEIITAATRRSRYPFQFETLTRAVSNTEAKLHPAGSIVYDLSHNTSAIDHLRRGFLVEYAIGEDLEIIARNLGLHRCPGMSQETLRRVIKAVAYLPKQTVHAFREALTALLDSSNFTIIERTTTDPFVVYVEIGIELSTDIRGRFFLNGGEPQLTTGLNTVDVDYAVNHVIGVYDDTPLTRRGFREGLTNYLNPGGSFLGQTITLGTSPGAAGTAVIVDYGAFDAHYLALNETIRQDIGQGDHWAYLADPLFAARCLLDQIRAAGVQVRLSTRL
jgi:hypothetical protein